jgi:WbqC-like protein family
MIVAIHQPNFMPWPGFFHKMMVADVFIYLDKVQYVKNALSNRNKIKTSHGARYLTVPVQVTSHRDAYDRVRIDQSAKSRWVKKHLKTLAFAYQKAPYYTKYFPGLEALYLKSWDRLIDLNLALIRYVADCMNIQTETCLESEIKGSGSGTERLISLCKNIGASVYLSGDGSPYLNEDLFLEEGIQLRYQRFAYPAYPQINGDFISHLSIIDLLFNCGSRSKDIISENQLNV